MSRRRTPVAPTEPSGWAAPVPLEPVEQERIIEGGREPVAEPHRSHLIHILMDLDEQLDRDREAALNPRHARRRPRWGRA